eukprot:1225035-Pleurochrysis_carterae.AAC.1
MQAVDAYIEFSLGRPLCLWCGTSTDSNHVYVCPMTEAWRKAGPNAPASATTPPPPNTSATYVNPAVPQPPIIATSTSDPKVVAGTSGHGQSATDTNT